MIKVDNVSKRYGNTEALAPTTLTFAPATTTVLIGPSGWGKSTLLRILVGLIAPDSGTVTIDGTQLNDHNVNAIRHKIGYVIQEGGLFPHLTNERNVTLLARHLGRPNGAIDKRVAELALLVQIPPTMLNRFPADLSGGQRQRVGLMRALMLDPEYLLLDEPLGALDPITRSELQTELKRIIERLGKTVVMVTHDMGEAAYFGTTIALMRAGAVVQIATIDELMRRPADPYVTEFIRAQRSPLPQIEPEAAQ